MRAAKKDIFLIGLVKILAGQAEEKNKEKMNNTDLSCRTVLGYITLEKQAN